MILLQVWKILMSNVKTLREEQPSSVSLIMALGEEVCSQATQQAELKQGGSNGPQSPCAACLPPLPVLPPCHPVLCLDTQVPASLQLRGFAESWNLCSLPPTEVSADDEREAGEMGNARSELDSCSPLKNDSVEALLCGCHELHFPSPGTGSQRADSFWGYTQLDLDMLPVMPDIKRKSWAVGGGSRVATRSGPIGL